MKNNRALIVTNIILLCCIIIGLLIFMIFGMKGSFTFYGGSTKLVDSKIFQNSDLNDVIIDVKSYDLKIEENSNSDIAIEVYGNEKTKNNLEITNTNNTLKVKQIRSTWCFGFCPSSSITIKLPKDYQGKYNINTVSGEIISTMNFYSEGNSITSTSGDISLLDVASGNVKSVSGDIKLNSISDSKIKTTSGDIEINNLKNGEISSISGEIEIANFIGSGNIETTSGDIDINNFEIAGNTNITSTSGDVKINLLNEAYVIAESVSGDKNIKNSRGEYDLKIKTVSGDITVR